MLVHSLLGSGPRRFHGFHKAVLLLALSTNINFQNATEVKTKFPRGETFKQWGKNLKETK